MVEVQLTNRNGQLVIRVGGHSAMPVKAVVVKKLAYFRTPDIKGFSNVYSGYVANEEQWRMLREEAMKKWGFARSWFSEVALPVIVNEGTAYIFDAKQIRLEGGIAYIEI